MWTRSLLKENAKNALRGRYWACFLACLVVSLLGGLDELRLNFLLDADEQFSFSAHYGRGWHFDLGYSPFAWFSLPFLLLGALLAVALAVGFAAFVSGPLSVGFRRYMMENRFGYSPFETIFSVFRGPYLNVVKGVFFTDLRILGWSLLFVIPGIYKSYQYFMVPYLLAENPYMTPQRARELSAAMTEGEKWNIFVLQLSFIGWHLVAALAAGFVTLGAFSGLGSYFVQPYCQATYAELYAALRAKAFALGLSGPDELSDFVRHTR